MKNRRNYYRILHVQPDAPREVIRSSYRTIMQRMRVHPDLGGDVGAAALVNEAYAVLNDEQHRSAYDRVHDSADWNRSANDARVNELQLASARARSCAFCAHPVPDQKYKGGLVGFCSSCDSPLAPASQLPADDADRREINRVPKRLSLALCTRWPQPVPHGGWADDVSLSGMRFMTNIYMATQQTIKIDSAALKAVALVVRCQSVGADWEIGVRFLNLCFTRSQGSFIQERV